MKKALSIILVCVLILCLAGCGGKKLTGTWENESGSSLQFSEDEMVWTMNEGGTGVSLTFEYEAEDGEITIYEDGTGLTGSYSIDGKELTIQGTYVIDGKWTKK